MRKREEEVKEEQREKGRTKGTGGEPRRRGMEWGEVKEEQSTLGWTRKRMRMDLQERMERRRKSL